MYTHAQKPAAIWELHHSYISIEMWWNMKTNKYDLYRENYCSKHHILEIVYETLKNNSLRRLKVVWGKQCHLQLGIQQKYIQHKQVLFKLQLKYFSPKMSTAFHISISVLAKTAVETTMWMSTRIPQMYVCLIICWRLRLNALSAHFGR